LIGALAQFVFLSIEPKSTNLAMRQFDLRVVVLNM
jgi:hypothetical protein